MRSQKPINFLFVALLFASLACSMLGGTGQNRLNPVSEPLPEPVVFVAGLGDVYGLVFDAAGNLYAPGTDGDRSVLWKIDLTGNKDCFAEIIDRGDVLSNAGFAAHARSLANVAVDGLGNIWLTSRKHGAGFVVSPERNVTKLYLNAHLSVSMEKERLPQGVAWDAAAGRLFLITSGPARALSAENKNYITTLIVSEQPDVLAQEVIAVKDTAGNKVKAIKAAGMPLQETGGGLITGPGSTLYFLGTDSLFQVNLGDGSLNRVGAPFAGQHLWGGAVDSAGTIYLSSNAAEYDPQEGGAGQGAVWRLESDGTWETIVEGIAVPLGLAWHNGYLYIADRATGSIFKVAAGQTPAQEEVSVGSAPPTAAQAASLPDPTEPVKPTASSTVTPAPTNTPFPEPTATPTQTPVLTDTPLPTSTHTPSPTWTPAPPPLTVQAETIARLDSQWVKRVVWSPDGSLLAVASTGLQLYRTDDFTERPGLSGSDWVFDTVFSPDGQVVATAFMAGKDVTLWTPNGGEVRSFPGSESAGRIAFSPDGTLLAATVGGTVRVWNVADGKELRTIPVGNTAGPLAFSPDGTLLAAMAGIAGMEIKVLNTTTWTEQFTLSGHSNWIRSIVFAPDGQTLASGSVDSTVRLWDTENGRQLRVFAGHTNDVEEVAFSPDGRLLASASWDLTVRLWDVASGAEVAQLTGHTGWVTTVAFSPDGTMLASGAEDQAARIWSLGGSAGAAAATPTLVPAATSAPDPSPVASTVTPASVASPATPTLTLPPANCPDSRVVITAPANGAAIRGIVPFMGSANLPDQISYKFEYKPVDSPIWQFLTQFEGQLVVNNKLMDFYSNTIAPGVYDFRLIAIDRTGNYPPPCEIQVTVER